MAPLGFLYAHSSNTLGEDTLENRKENRRAIKVRVTRIRNKEDMRDFVEREITDHGGSFDIEYGGGDAMS